MRYGEREVKDVWRQVWGQGKKEGREQVREGKVTRGERKVEKG